MKPSPTTPPAQNRHLMTVEYSPNAGTTPTESLEWMQKFFDFFHPGMKAKLVSKVAVTGEPVELRPEHYVSKLGSAAVAAALDESLLSGEGVAPVVEDDDLL